MQELRITTEMEFEKVLNTFKELVGSDKSMRVNAKYSGVVKDDEFRFTDFSVAPSFLCPILKGNISKAGEKTEILGDFTKPWIGYFALFTIFVVLYSLSIEIIPVITIIILLAVFLFSYRKYVMKKMLKELNEVFNNAL